MEFDNLSFNWRRNAISNNELEILTASGSLLGTLFFRCMFSIATNRVKFMSDVQGNPIWAEADALDTEYGYWRLSVEDGTLTQIPASSLKVNISEADYRGIGFEYRRRSRRDLTTLDFRFESLANFFSQCNRLRGKWMVVFSSPDLPDTALTDLDAQFAYLEFADEAMESRYNTNIVIPSKLWDYEEKGECAAYTHVVFEGQ